MARSSDRAPGKRQNSEGPNGIFLPDCKSRLKYKQLYDSDIREAAVSALLTCPSASFLLFPRIFTIPVTRLTFVWGIRGMFSVSSLMVTPLVQNSVRMSVVPDFRKFVRFSLSSW